MLLRMGPGDSASGQGRKESSKEIMGGYESIAVWGHFLLKADPGLFIAVALTTLRGSLYDSVALLSDSHTNDIESLRKL